MGVLSLMVCDCANDCVVCHDGVESNKKSQNDSTFHSVSQEYTRESGGLSAPAWYDSSIGSAAPLSMASSGLEING
jgi:hypothetical protein